MTRTLAVPAILLLAAAAALADAPVLRIATSKGILIVETDDPDIEVTVKRKGEVVAITDLRSKKQVELRAGEYELRLVEGVRELELSTNTFTLKRAGKAVAFVRHEPLPLEKVGEIRRVAT